MPDPSFFLPLFLQSAVLPFGIAFALLIASRPSALVLTAGFLASYFAVFHAQWSPLPHQALDWMPWIGVLGTAGAVVAEKAASAWRFALRLVLAAAMSLVTVLPALASLGAAKAALVGLLAAALVFVAWSWLAQVTQKRPTPAPLLMIIAGGAGLAMMLDASQAIGQLFGALAAALAAFVVLGMSRLRSGLDAAASGAAVLLAGALLLNAYLYAGFSLGYIALLAAALLADPLFAGIQNLRGRENGGRAWVGSAMLALVPVAVALALVVRAAQESGGY